MAKNPGHIISFEEMMDKAKSATFLPECKYQRQVGTVTKCDNPYNYRFSSACSKRCANPTKEKD